MRAWAMAGVLAGAAALAGAGAGAAHARGPRAQPGPPIDAACDDLPLGPLADALDRELELRPRDAARLAPVARLVRTGNRGALCAALARLSWRTLSRRVAFTAYDSPTVAGSLTRDAAHQTPLYRRPPDLTTCPDGSRGKLAGRACVPYDTTAEILGGSLAGRGLELVWLADPYDALVLSVEGGGIVALPDGRRLTVGAAGNNGHPYQNVTRLLAADGKLPAGPAPPSPAAGNPKARRYFHDHPAELATYWGKNPHYVFFAEVAAAGSGQLGALTPGRSVSIDPAVVPMGALLWIRAQKPIINGGRITGWQRFARLVLGQDTGAAIRGNRRVEIYWGDDDDARVAAAGASSTGEAYLLVGR